MREVRVRLDTGKVLRILTNDLVAPAHEARDLVEALLRQHAEGLIGLSGCLKGEVAGALARGNFTSAKKASSSIVSSISHAL